MFREVIVTGTHHFPRNVLKTPLRVAPNKLERLPSMRGEHQQQLSVFSYVAAEDRIGSS